jgi:hypothetical protein
MRRTILFLALIFALAPLAVALDMADVPLADGFDPPVGKNGKSYYVARGVRPNGHLGEDWNGIGGGDTDLGDPIYAAADGIVTFGEDYRLGWGNVVIIRSAYLENGETKYVDSLYGHLLDFTVRVGQTVKRGQQIARMGNNRGMYDAHLHFEMRKNINVGMYRSSFPRDWSVYWSPREFVAGHRTCSGDSRIVSVPVNTYPNSPPPIIASTKVYTPSQGVSRAGISVAGGKMAKHSVPPSSLRRVYASTASASSSGRSTGSTTRPISVASTTSTTSTKSAPKTIVTAPVKTIAAGPVKTKVPIPATPVPEKRKVPVKHPLFRVNRFEDMKILGYGTDQ